MTTEELMKAVSDWAEKPERHVLCIFVESQDDAGDSCNVLLNGNVLRLSANAVGSISNPENKAEGLERFLDITERMRKLVPEVKRPVKSKKPLS